MKRIFVKIDNTTYVANWRLNTSVEVANDTIIIASCTCYKILTIPQNKTIHTLVIPVEHCHKVRKPANWDKDIKLKL